jgi:Fe-S-cluster-containing dehydrogenase component
MSWTEATKEIVCNGCRRSVEGCAYGLPEGWMKVEPSLHVCHECLHRAKFDARAPVVPNPSELAVMPL